MLRRVAAVVSPLLILLAVMRPVLAQGQDAVRSPALERKLEMTPAKEHNAVLTRALTWLTGGAQENDYVSVGRLANYFGFVWFRVASGHTIRRGGVGQQAFASLDGSQRLALLHLLDEQWPALEACQAARVELNRRLEGLLVGRAATAAEIESLGAAFGEREAELGLVLARGFAGIAATLRPEQRAAWAGVRATGLRGELGEFRLDGASKAAIRATVGELDGRRGQELWNLAANLLCWVSGTTEANDYDTVGKPSQHFGFVALRLASGHAVTRHGIAEATAALLDAAQQQPLREVVPANRDDFAAFFAARAAINRALEAGLHGGPIDGEVVRAAGRQQGLAEARMTWRQAQAFLRLRDALRPAQREALLELRGRYVLPPSGELLADPALPADQQQLAAGERIYAACALCHPVDGSRGVGPSLRGIVGRPVASLAGYDYSPALRARAAAGERWTRDALSAFLAAPQRHTPGTRMPFAGLPDAAPREALLAWLEQRDGSLPATAAAGPAAAAPAAAAVAGPGAAPQPPNIVVVLLEGTGGGWASTSVAMDEGLPAAKAFAAQTPQLQAFAAQGVRFAEFYMASPRCTPSRASLLTGMGAARLGITYVNEGGESRRGGRRSEPEPVDDPAATERLLLTPPSRTELPESVTTVAELLRQRGYASAHFGKWHVGRARPGVHGFDSDDGANTNQGPDRSVKPNPGEAAAITDRGLAFAKAQAAAKRPFYLQLSHYGGGTEDESRAETRQALAAELRGLRGKTAWQAAVLRDVDDQFGRLLAGLEQLGLAGNTYVVVTFDHGAAGRNANAPLRGGKGSVYEGGLRVPFVVRGPGIPAGRCAHVRASSADLLPTCAEWAGIGRLPAGVEGGSLAAVLARGGAGTVVRPREELVVHFPHYDLGSAPATAIYLGDHKLVRHYETGQQELFDLTRDPGETRDLAAAQPELLAELARRLDLALREAGAALPQPNPQYRRRE